MPTKDEMLIARRQLDPTKPPITPPPDLPPTPPLVHSVACGGTRRGEKGEPEVETFRHAVTLSPCHPVTLSPCHPVTLSPCHLVTLSHLPPTPPPGYSGTFGNMDGNG
jgi:hypothetical protein